MLADDIFFTVLFLGDGLVNVSFFSLGDKTKYLVMREGRIDFICEIGKSYQTFFCGMRHVPISQGYLGTYLTELPSRSQLVTVAHTYNIVNCITTNCKNTRPWLDFTALSHWDKQGKFYSNPK